MKFVTKLEPSLNFHSIEDPDEHSRWGHTFVALLLLVHAHHQRSNSDHDMNAYARKQMDALEGDVPNFNYDEPQVPDHVIFAAIEDAHQEETVGIFHATSKPAEKLGVTVNEGQPAYQAVITIRPDYAGLHVLQQTLKWLEKTIKRMQSVDQELPSGIKLVCVLDTSDQDAMTTFEKAGFTEEARTDVTFSGNTKPTPAAVMTCEVAAP